MRFQVEADALNDALEWLSITGAPFVRIGPTKLTARKTLAAEVFTPFRSEDAFDDFAVSLSRLATWASSASGTLHAELTDTGLTIADAHGWRATIGRHAQPEDIALITAPDVDAEAFLPDDLWAIARWVARFRSTTVAGMAAGVLVRDGAVFATDNTKMGHCRFAEASSLTFGLPIDLVAASKSFDGMGATEHEGHIWVMAKDRLLVAPLLAGDVPKSPMEKVTAGAERWVEVEREEYVEALGRVARLAEGRATVAVDGALVRITATSGEKEPVEDVVTVQSRSDDPLVFTTLLSAASSLGASLDGSMLKLCQSEPNFPVYAKEGPRTVVASVVKEN